MSTNSMRCRTLKPKSPRPTLKRALTQLVILLSVLSWVQSAKHYSTAKTRNDKCTAGVRFSPIELNFPEMDYLPFQIKMDFLNSNKVNLRKVDNNHMAYLADFGKVSYLDVPYKVDRVDVFSPSLHMAFGVVYPLEVQLKAKSATGSVITLAYLFDKFGNNHNQFLNSLSFQAGKIKQMPVTGDDIPLKNDVSLRFLVEDKSGFMMYEGQSLIGNCESSLIFVSSEISWMSETQFQELIPTSQMKGTVARPKGMVVYQNFLEDFGNKPLKFNSTIDLSRFPVALQNVPAMYLPDEYHKIGFIPSDYVAAWNTLNGTLEDQVMQPAPQGMKLQPFCYKPLRQGVYTTQYILVPKDYQLAKNIQPESIEVYVRTNTQYNNGVRDIIKIAMPIEHNPVDKVALEAIKQEEKKRLDAEKAVVKKAEEKKKAQAEAVERIVKLQQATSTKKLKFKRVCDKWEVESIMNRNWNNNDSWDLPDLMKGGDRDLLTCKHWRVILVNDDGSDVVENPVPDLPTTPSNSTTPSNNSSSSQPAGPRPNNPLPPVSIPDIGPIDQEQCGTYLTIVLNQRFQNLKVKDYVLDKCKSWQSQEIPKATALAMIRSELSRRSKGLSLEGQESGQENAASPKPNENTAETTLVI